MQRNITISSIIKWLLSNDDEIPNEFRLNKSKTRYTLSYLHEYLIMQPKIVLYLNDYINTYDRPIDTFELLNLYKKLFRMAGLIRRDIWNYFPKRDPMNKTIEVLQDKDKLQLDDARQIIRMHQLLEKPLDDDLIALVTPNKKAASKDQDLNDYAQEIIDISKENKA